MPNIYDLIPEEEKGNLDTQSCAVCNGTGRVRQGTPVEIVPCQQCKGSGITIQQLKDILKETLNPERCLETWYCKNCGCMCAGDQTSGMCMGCEELTPEQRGEEG